MHKLPFRPRSRCAGFTLVETMVVVGIASVLSSIAVASFNGYLLRARRTDALVSILQVQLAEERWRANASSVGSLAEIGAGTTSKGGHYALDLAVGTDGGYQITASAIGAQTRDAACRVLRLSVGGGNLGYASGPGADVSNPAADNRRCWSL